MDKDIEVLKNLRKEIFITAYKGGIGHLASCFSCLEIVYALYKNILKLNSNDPKWDDRDRFILSKGHAGLALYAVLMEMGLISKEQFHNYLVPGENMGGEPCMRDCPWVEASTGSLGHGISMAMGMALAQKIDKKDVKVYCIIGDGECQEGCVWETAINAASFKLDNFVVILDCNDVQKMDFVNNIMGNPNWKDKWQSFGWQVLEVDGHDLDAIKKCLESDFEKDKPKFIIAHTVKGKGVSIMENNPNWHFKLPNKKELKVFMDELQIKESELI